MRNFNVTYSIIFLSSFFSDKKQILALIFGAAISGVGFLCLFTIKISFIKSNKYSLQMPQMISLYRLTVNVSNKHPSEKCLNLELYFSTSYFYKMSIKTMWEIDKLIIIYSQYIVLVYSSFIFTMFIVIILFSNIVFKKQGLENRLIP